jgi:hypothetical protein
MARPFSSTPAKLRESEFLFDISVEAVDLPVPGGALAIKLARRAIEVAQKRHES